MYVCMCVCVCVCCAVLCAVLFVVTGVRMCTDVLIALFVQEMPPVWQSDKYVLAHIQVSDLFVLSGMLP